MSSDRDPPRLSEFGGLAPPPLRELFEQAREDLPSASRLEALWARIEPLTGPAAPPEPPEAPPAGPAPSAPFTGLGATALIGAFGVLGTAGALAYVLARPAPPPEGRTAAPSASATSAYSAPEPTPNQAPAPAAEPVPAAPSSAAASSPPAPSARVSPRRSETRGSAGAAKPLADAKAEAALLERARTVMASDPKRALALTREHARRFPEGILAQEREVIAIEALKRLGKASEVESRVEQFKKSYPGSVHQRGLDSGTTRR